VLPQKEAEPFRNAAYAKLPPKYRLLIDVYYRRQATEKPAQDD
jgi:hypothetical protein